jgi:uncharacterized protein YoaH (UPF0181 family)
VNGSKNFLASKTYQGIIIMILVKVMAAVLPKLGVDLPDTDLTYMAEQLIFAAGAVWAAVGRATAKKDVALGKGSVVLALLLCVGMTTGCAIKQVAQHPAHEQARYYAEQMGRTYIDLHNGYLEAWPSLTPEQQAWAGENLKPVMNKTKIAIDMAIGAAKTWSIAAEKCESVQVEASAADNGAQSDSAQLAALESDLAKCEAARIDYEALATEAMDLLDSAQRLYQSFKDNPKSAPVEQED